MSIPLAYNELVMQSLLRPHPAWIVGHRGVAGEAIENTMESYWLAGMAKLASAGAIGVDEALGGSPTRSRREPEWTVDCALELRGQWHSFVQRTLEFWRVSLEGVDPRSRPAARCISHPAQLPGRRSPSCDRGRQATCCVLE